MRFHVEQFHGKLLVCILILKIIHLTQCRTHRGQGLCMQYYQIAINMCSRYSRLHEAMVTRNNSSTDKIYIGGSYHNLTGTQSQMMVPSKCLDIRSTNELHAKNKQKSGSNKNLPLLDAICAVPVCVLHHWTNWGLWAHISSSKQVNSDLSPVQLKAVT